MVENTVTDGKRIAQLLASELTGLDAGLLGDISVSDADPDAVPTDSGTDAYTIVAGDDPVGTVSMFPEYATVTFERTVSWPDGDQRPELLDESDDTLVVSSGAAVKRAVDAIRLWLDLRDTDGTSLGS
jgi:hypothetical protein